VKVVDRLSLGLTRRLPVVLQNESAECGLACIVMVAAHFGYHTDLPSLRRKCPIPVGGARLTALAEVAGSLNLATRAVRVDLENIGQLKLPCILHWNLQHFVVLKSVSRSGITIIDPAHGVRKVSMAAASSAFTGVALEVWPNPGFERREVKQRIRLGDLMGHVKGLRRALGQVLLLALVLEAFTICSPLFLQWVIDNVLLSADRALLATLAIGFGLLFVLQQLVTTFRGWCIIRLGTTLGMQWRANVFTYLLRLPGHYFEKRHVGDVLSRFSSIDAIQRTITRSFVEGVLDGLMTLVTVTMLFVYSPALAWISMGAMALYGLGRWAWYRPLRNATEEQIIHAAKQNSHFLETLRGVRTIKLFQRYEERRGSWLTLLADQLNADIKTQKLYLYYSLLNGLLSGVTNVAIVWLGAHLVLDGNLTVGMLMAFMSYKGQFVTRVASLIDKSVEWKMIQLQGERLADIVLTESEDRKEGDRLVRSEQRALEPSIELRNVCFRYGPHEPVILDGVNLQVAAGESVAITGPSGCGKTTLMNILVGLLEPTDGEVIIGGVSVRSLGIQTLRGMVGTVTQDDMLFDGTVLDNICFFHSNPDQDWIEECGRLAAIHDDIVRMPMGYNTPVGYMGSVLSGGQKQRVLLARALYRRPRILLLDEATSHLDIPTEGVVSDMMSKLGMTRVLVAHRPQAVATADHVARMQFGRIESVQRNSHRGIADILATK